MKQPVRLGKPEPTLQEQFLEKYSSVIIAVFVIILLILILLVIIKFIDIASAHNSTMSMVESGNYYYHLKDVI